MIVWERRPVCRPLAQACVRPLASAHAHDERTEPGLHIGEEESEPVEFRAARICDAGSCRGMMGRPLIEPIEADRAGGLRIYATKLRIRAKRLRSLTYTPALESTFTHILVDPMNGRCFLCASHVRERSCEMPVYGYARVSTTGQTLAAQLEALRAAGAVKVYSEKASGAKSDRPQLAKLIKALAPGDQVIVTRLDRLARSTRDLLNTLDAVASAGAKFKSLADAWADTTTAHGRLILTVLGGLAEFERELIRQRTGEGRDRAKALRAIQESPKLQKLAEQERRRTFWLTP